MKDSTQKTLLTVGLIGGGLLIAGKIFGGISTIFSGGVPPSKQKYLKDKYTRHEDLIKALNINQNALSFARGIYKEIAERQYDAMLGAGTDEKILFDSLKGLNADDLKTVFMDFGLRASLLDPVGYTRKDLIQWYEKELGSSDLKRMADIWRPTGLMRWET